MSDMDVFQWPKCKAPVVKESVATLGVFDGVHIGHQSILKQVMADARRMGLPSAVITFDRHPHQVLDAPLQPCITSLDHRLRLFDEMGVDMGLVVGFTDAVASMPARKFAESVFRDLLGVRELILGFDSRFGKGREGDIAMCRRWGEEWGMEARSLPPVRVNGEIVSSTAIREAVRRADLKRAASLLGRPFSLLGTVVKGEGIGHDLGFPTANLDAHNELLPPEGVYATRTRLNGSVIDSVTSVGRRETFADYDLAMPLVEVHLLDNDVNDIYGEDIEVQFECWLRGQRRFGDAKKLVGQIRRDVERAKAVLG